MSTHGAPPPRHREWKLGCKVYIGNLSEGASKADIEGAFSKFGPLRNVWVARNPPGFAFVEFEDGRDAEDACRHLDGTRIAGARIKAEMSHGRTRRGRGGGPPGFGRPPPYAMGGYGGPPMRGGYLGSTRGAPYNGHHDSDYPYPPAPHHHASRGGYASGHHHHGYVSHGGRDRHHGAHHGPPPAHHRGAPRSPPGNGAGQTKDSFRHYSRSRSNSIDKSPMRTTARPRTPPSRTPPTPVDRH